MGSYAPCDRCQEADAAYILSDMSNGNTTYLCFECLAATALDIFEAISGPQVVDLDTPAGDGPHAEPAGAPDTQDAGAYQPPDANDTADIGAGGAGSGDGGDGVTPITPTPPPARSTRRKGKTQVAPETAHDDPGATK